MILFYEKEKMAARDVACASCSRSGHRRLALLRLPAGSDRHFGGLQPFYEGYPEAQRQKRRNDHRPVHSTEQYALAPAHRLQRLGVYSLLL